MIYHLPVNVDEWRRERVRVDTERERLELVRECRQWKKVRQTVLRARKARRWV